MAKTLPNPFPGNLTTKTTNKIAKPKKKKFGKGVAAGHNGTLIAFVMDESGSMFVVQDATIDGFNKYVNGQKKTDGECVVKVNKFEGGNIVDLWGMKDINSTPKMSRELYQPAGMTNLNDAIGQTVEEIDQHLKGMKKKERPAVLVVIMTDGHENASRKFSTKEIKKLVALREKKDWGFTFIGADIDAFATSANYGMNTSNTMQYSKGATAEAFASMSASTTRFRSAKAFGASTKDLYEIGLYTDEERVKSNGGE